MLGIVMPVWIQSEATLKMTQECVKKIVSNKPAMLFVVTTRLHGLPPEQLRDSLDDGVFPVRVLHTPNVSMSVAAAWNSGLGEAIKRGCDRLMILSNDVMLESDTIDLLSAYGDANADIDLWSGLNVRDAANIITDPEAVTTGTDFCAFMMRPSTLERHGSFYERFKPAYFEDNDYYARVVLGGGKCRQVHAATYAHLGSMTRRLDSEARHHCDYWFEANRRRFYAKWGLTAVPNTPEEVLAKCYRHPWNNPANALTWWDQE